jgi:GT2 family glycosyltransferase
MGMSSPENLERTFASPLQEKEQALQALTARAANSRQGLRELTQKIATGQREIEVLVRFFEEHAEFDEEFARHVLTTEQTAQHLAQRLAQVERDFRTLESELHARAGGLTEFAALSLLGEVRSSRSWRVAQMVHRARLVVLPVGSRRERLARLGLKALRTWRQEGFLAMVRKSFLKTARKLARILRTWGAWLRLLPPGESALFRVGAPSLESASSRPTGVLYWGPANCSAAAPHIHIDEFLQLDERSYYVKGWTWGDNVRGTNLTAICSRGGRTTLENVFKYARADVCAFFGVASHAQENRKPAFVGFFQTASEVPAGNWTLECYGDQGGIARTAVKAATGPLQQMRENILSDLRFPGDRDLLLRHHIVPAMKCLQQQIGKPELERIEQYGAPPAAPVSSLVIPLYRRIDFLEHQLAQFVRDPEVCRADLVYVLDSPELADALHARALQLSRLYRVPYRIAYLRSNVGYAGATNAGVEQARGRLLVLLNSDVLPDRPGWLGQMAAFYMKNPRLGALGPKLVYEDETLQHAGMYFARQPGSAVWENAHFYKGLHRYFPPAQETRIVPAVTGACLMIKDDRYQEMGGLQNLFIQGDYEDSDLCLRLHQKGYENWYLAQCELYHLEGQSYPGPLRSLVYQYNSWLHNHLWGKHIEEIMTQMMSVPVSTENTRAA